MATKWNIEQENVILKEAENNPEHLRYAFYLASLKINKTPEAVCTRYYNHILKTKPKQDASNKRTFNPYK